MRATSRRPLRRPPQVALRALGFPVKKADVADLLLRLGEDGRAQLDYDAFRKVVSHKLQERSVLDELKRAFQLFDVLGTGKIDFATLSRVVKSLNLDIPEDELQGMIAEFDHDRDGMINEQEFLAILAGSDD